MVENVLICYFVVIKDAILFFLCHLPSQNSLPEEHKKVMILMMDDNNGNSIDHTSNSCPSSLY